MLHKYLRSLSVLLCISSFTLLAKAETVNPSICWAYHSYASDSSTMVTEEVQLAVESQSGGHLQMSVDFKGRSFSALYFKDSDELLLQIVQSEDTTRGLVSRGRLDQKRSIALTEVQGATVYKLECHR